MVKIKKLWRHQIPSRASLLESILSPANEAYLRNRWLSTEM